MKLIRSRLNIPQNLVILLPDDHILFTIESQLVIARNHNLVRMRESA